MNVEINSIKGDEDFEKFRNHGDFATVCPVCRDDFGHKKVVRKSFKDEFGDEWKVVMHKGCRDNVRIKDVIDCLCQDEKYANVSFAYQDEIAETLLEMLYKF